MSFNKGMKMLFEAIILLIMMLSVILKANVFSIFYLLFIAKYILTGNKLFLMVDIIKYSVLFAVFQYAIVLLNLNDGSAAQRFPP
jgi:hypothetical protein